MKKTLSKIYGYRSRALHDGKPFPAPMCLPPFKEDPSWAAHAEKPIGLATSTLGATWLADDVPILLNTFEYIVRGCLLKWWKSLYSAI